MTFLFGMVIGAGLATLVATAVVLINTKRGKYK